MFIYSAEDLNSFAYLSGVPRFDNNPDYYGMDIDPSSIAESERYISFDGLLNYSNGQEVEINISIAKEETYIPNLKISPIEEEE